MRGGGTIPWFRVMNVAARDERLSRGFHAGWVAWLVFCFVAVVLRGVRWDETYEHAQVLLGLVSYPSGHPLPRYVSGVYSIQPFATALLLHLWPSEAVVNGLRNGLMLAANLVPVYLLAAWLTRNVVCGFLATVLVLQGVLLELDGSYPLIVWPDIFSNGPVGQGYALLVLFLLLRGNDRAGGLLLGLLPCVHIGQAPAMALWALLLVAYRARRDGLRSVFVLAGSTMLGVALAASFALIPHAMKLAAPGSGPYAVEGDVDAIWRGYTFFADPHRRLPSINGQIALVAALALGVRLAVHEWKEHGRAGARCGMLAYVAVVAAVVWVSMATHVALGERTPFLVLGWMPYRLINHIPPLLLVMICDSLARGKNGQTIVAASVVYAALASLPPRDIGFARYLDPAVCVMFVLAGASWVSLASDERTRSMYIPGAMFVVALAMFHQWGGVCVVAGAAIAVVARAYALKHCVAWAACAVAVALVLGVQARHRNHLPRTAFDRAAAAIMDDGGMMVAGRPDEFTLQARLGRPVVVESATASLISYMPELGPAVNALFSDFYGMRFDASPNDARPGWEHVWEARSLQEWQALRETYGVGYLAAPEGLDVNLELLLEESGSRLYRIPPLEPAS